MAEPVTIKEVAREAGVAVSTVSLALRGDRRVREQTRVRVEAAARRLGYRRDAVYSLLGSRQGRRRRAGGTPIAWVHQPVPGLRDGPWAPFLEPAMERASALGYSVQRYSLDQFESPTQVRRVLFARGVVGVILESFRSREAVLAVDWSPFTVVCCGVYHEELPFHTVRGSTFRAGRLAFREAWRRGYRRIGVAVLAHDPPQIDDAGRFGGAFSAEVESGAVRDRIPPFFGKLSEAAGVTDWVREHRPDAVLGFHSGLIHYVRDAGYRVPEEITFAALAVGGEGPREGPRLSGVDYRRSETGAASVDYLDQLLRSGERGTPEHPRSLITSCAWIEGETLPFRGVGPSAGARFPGGNPSSASL